MKTIFYRLLSQFTAKNFASTPIPLIKEQLTEKRALPTGATEFHEWSDRIISGAMISATPESQKFALANTLINLSPTTAFETDLYFIHVLRKNAVNQVADEMRRMIRDAAKARLEEEEKQKKDAVTSTPAQDAQILAIKKI